MMSAPEDADPNRTPAFLSYVCADDDYLNDAISRLRAEIEDAVAFLGVKGFKIFQDKDDIGLGQQWLNRLKLAISEAHFFIPMITPRYFENENCRAEARYFRRHEENRGRNDLILPIYVWKVEEFENSKHHACNNLAENFAQRQFFDFRELINEPRENPERRSKVIALAEAIKKAAKRTAKPQPALTEAQQTTPDDASFGFGLEEAPSFDHQIVDLKNQIETLKKWRQYMVGLCVVIFIAGTVGGWMARSAVRKPNMARLLDLVEDNWHANYEGAPVDGRPWIGGNNTRRVLRGGSWSYNPRNLRSANRREDQQGNRNAGDGFRVAKTLSP